MKLRKLLVIFTIIYTNCLNNNCLLSAQSFGGTITHIAILQKFANYPPESATILTYRPNFEAFIQTASNTIGKITGNSESNTDSNSGSNSSYGITGFIARTAETIFSPIGRVVKMGFGRFLNQNGDQMKAIFPGTRWCGDGNISRQGREFGLFKRTDACCKQHDHCPLALGSGESLGPLKNDGIFTRSWCACDIEFYNCLQQANNPIAKEIGTTYFTVLSPQCIDYGYPIMSCLERGGKRVFNRKCVKYQYDKTQNLTLQWYDNQDF